MWSLFLNEHLYLNGMLQGFFVVENRHKRNMYFEEIGICSQSIDIILGSIINTIWGAYVRILPLTSYNYCISALVLKLEMTVFVIQNCSVDIPYPK